MYGYIYETYDTLTNKYYLGKHKSESYDKNYFGSGKIITKIINKRKETLKNQLICWCDTLEELNEKEKYYIQQYNSLKPNGYNISLGGDGGPIHFQKHTEEAKEKMSKKKKGKPSTFKGKHFTYEQRKLISKRVKEAFDNGKGQNIDRHSYWTLENRKKKSEQMKGKTPWNKGKHGVYSEETLEKLRNYAKNQICTKETRQKMSMARKGKKHSEETKRKISIANKGKKLSPESIKKMSETLKNKPKIKDIDLFNKLVTDKDIIYFFSQGPRHYHSGWNKLLSEKLGYNVKHSNNLPKSEFIKYYKEHKIIEDL